MRMMRYLLLFGGIACTPTSILHAAAESWYAIAFAPDGAAGWSKERKTKAAAEEEAFRNCAGASKRPRECKVVFVPKGSCAVITHCAVGGQDSVWTAVAQRLKDALDESMDQAVAAGLSEQSCKPLVQWCPE